MWFLDFLFFVSQKLHYLQHKQSPVFLRHHHSANDHVTWFSKLLGVATSLLSWAMVHAGNVALVSGQVERQEELVAQQDLLFSKTPAETLSAKPVGVYPCPKPDLKHWDTRRHPSKALTPTPSAGQARRFKWTMIWGVCPNQNH